MNLPNVVVQSESETVRNAVTPSAATRYNVCTHSAIGRRRQPGAGRVRPAIGVQGIGTGPTRGGGGGGARGGGGGPPRPGGGGKGKGPPRGGGGGSRP